MWSRTLRSARSQLRQPRHLTFPRRNIGGQPQQQTQQPPVPHTTYFQQPPPQTPKRGRRILRNVLWSTFCFSAGAVTLVYNLGVTPAMLADLQGAVEDSETVNEALIAGTSDAAARHVPPIDAAHATQLLVARSGFSVTPKAVAHTVTSTSNQPCEDTWSSGAYNLFNDQKRDWYEWAIFDGHAGPRTSQYLKDHLPSFVGEQLWEAKCMDQPNEARITSTIKKAFQTMDDAIVKEAGNRLKAGGPLAEMVALGAAAFSGSCALLALYDPVRSILRIANVGDSRAVLGRWSPISQSYVAVPLSVDQTGFNQDEVDRIAREHPGEENIVDPKSGRVFGLAISRAFGDARWKWPESLTRLAHEKFFGPSPRPNGVVKTPPYITAEPEVTTTKINSSSEHPDFVIMASDGLWDNLSSDDAVTCVQQWLTKNKPEAFLEDDKGSAQLQEMVRRRESGLQATFTPASDLEDGDDIWYDAEERCLKWKTSPKHFVNEDDHAAVHLVKNALGGKRRDLFEGLMSVQTPYSRNVRDDITVHVIFFGVETPVQPQ